MQSFGTNPADSLHQELTAARHLLQCLKQEQAHLIKADIDALSILTAEKAAVVACVSDLAKWRHRALAALGFPAREAGMRAWLDNGALENEAASAGKAWGELQALAQSAKELNRINGALINAQLTRNQTALNVLRSNAQGGNFYGPDGQPSTAVPARSLVVG